MDKIEFVKIKGKDVAFIDESIPDSEDSLVEVLVCSSCVCRCGSRVRKGEFVTANAKGEIIPAKGLDRIGIVSEVRGADALVDLI